MEQERLVLKPQRQQCWLKVSFLCFWRWLVSDSLWPSSSLNRCVMPLQLPLEPSWPILVCKRLKVLDLSWEMSQQLSPLVAVQKTKGLLLLPWPRTVSTLEVVLVFLVALTLVTILKNPPWQVELLGLELWEWLLPESCWRTRIALLLSLELVLSASSAGFPTPR